MSQGLRDGITFYDDFTHKMVQAANVAATATTLPDPWTAFTDATAGSTIASTVEPTDALGAMTLAVTTTQEGIHMGLFTQGNTGTVIDPGGLTASNRVWLEGRFKFASIVTQEIGFFFGLMEKGRCITLGTIATGGAAVAAVDHVGFLKKSASTTAIGTSSGDGTSTDLNTTAGTVAAATYINLGLKWDGTTAKFYINGVADSKTLNAASTGFPLTEGLTPMIGVLGGSTADDETVICDWVKFAYERIK